MKVECYGKKKGSFVNDNGEVVDYCKIFCVYPMSSNSSEQSEGREAGAISIPKDFYDKIPIDSELELSFNQKGKLIALEVL